MITIDLVNEYIDQTEKPQHRSFSVVLAYRGAATEQIVAVAQSHQSELIEAAHQARLVRAVRELCKGESVPVDVQRYTEHEVTSLTLAEGYIFRLLHLASGN